MIALIQVMVIFHPSAGSTATNQPTNQTLQKHEKPNNSRTRL